MRSVFSEPVKMMHSGSLPGSHGRWVAMVYRQSPRISVDTASRLFLLSCARGIESPRTSAKHGSGQKEVASGHTIR